jgi:hypothetical protein
VKAPFHTTKTQTFSKHWKSEIRIALSFIIGMIKSTPALADRIMIPWTAGDPAAETMPWAVVNAAEMNGWTKNFKNDTIEEHRQISPDRRA